MTGCRHFSGYKPCGLSPTCEASCANLDIPKVRVLVVSLEALGAVLRVTSILPAIKRRFPSSHITWITQAPADQLLLGNHLIDRLLTTSTSDLLSFSALSFDVALVVDKSLKAGGLLNHTQVDQVYGFVVDSHTGAVMPATAAAGELWQIGLSDQKKFFENQKTEAQLICESLELEYRRDSYILNLTATEQAEVARRRSSWAPHREKVVGLNTGCSGTIAYKKMSIESHRKLIHELSDIRGLRVVLLGGREDTERNQKIGSGFDLVQSDTTLGLRDGVLSAAACDIIVSGDSLGLHLGVALKKWVVAWFGPTCAHEIDLYDHGVKVLSQVSCGPCWKRSCAKDVMCYDQVRTSDLVNAIMAGVQRREEAKIEAGKLETATFESLAP